MSRDVSNGGRERNKLGHRGNQFRGAKRFGDGAWLLRIAWRPGHRAFYIDTPWFMFDFGLRPDRDWFVEGAWGA